jgi:hypothetical protein
MTWIEIRLSDFYAPELNEPGGRQARWICLLAVRRSARRSGATTAPRAPTTA